MFLVILSTLYLSFFCNCFACLNQPTGLFDVYLYAKNQLHLWFPYCKLATLGTLGMLDHLHHKSQYQFVGSFHAYLQAQNQSHFSRFPWDNAKILQNCYFGYYGHALLCTPKVILSTCRKLLCYLQAKYQLNSQSFSEYCQDVQTYFWYFGHAWPFTPKIIVSI